MSAIMFDLLKTVRVILKFDTIRIDNNISRLHYKLTVILLITFSLLITSKQYFGDPIRCSISGESEKFSLDTYCWIFSTFTVKKHMPQHTVGKQSIQPGVGPYTEKDETVSQKYYQWVCFMLALQAATFYIPRHLWKTWEGGRLKMLVGDLGFPVISPEWNDVRKKMLLTYLAKTNRNTHGLYAFRFVFCEVLNFINVICQVYLINLFLGGTFTSYGPKVFTFAESKPEERIDPMAQAFPKVAKCTYRYVGPSGTIQIIDALCILPLNILNEKIFVILWFWFVILSIVSLLLVLYRFMVIYSPTLRKYLLMAQARYVKRALVEQIVFQLKYGDWLILNMLGKNVNPIIFREVVNELGIYLMSDDKTREELLP